ncbi:MAG: YdcF family protein [Candidatus Rickettsia vulgarisii]
MKNIILSIFIIFLLWVVGFAYYIYTVESYKINNSTTTDAIVSLDGRQRIETGISLLKAGYAPILFIAGIESKNQLKNLLSEYNVKTSQVIYANSSYAGKDDIQEVVEFIINNNIRSIRLVNSSYDMPVAINNITKTTHNIIIVPHPILIEHNKYKILFNEYNKYLKTLLIGSFL